MSLSYNIAYDNGINGLVVHKTSNAAVFLESLALNRFVTHRPTPFFFRKYLRKSNFVVYIATVYYI